MKLMLLKNMKTEFINLAVNCQLITDDSESFQCLHCKYCREHLETSSEKPTIKVDVSITISIKTII